MYKADQKFKDQYVVVMGLGKGAFGEVYLVEDKRSDFKYFGL